MAPASKLVSQNVGYYRYYPALTLGKGNFATVYLARHKVVKCDVAMKIINTDDIKEEYVQRNLDREAKIMRTLHHPNIIQLYEVIKEGNLYCLSLELVRGANLYLYMKNQPNHIIPEKLARYFFYQMLEAVEYMHNLNVIHRDLKLENILVEYGHIIKIADFGLSNIYYPSLELRTHCGSIEYAAPELFQSSAYGTAADVWSLGVVLYAMVIGKMPFIFCQKKGEYIFNKRMRHLFMQRISKGLMQENWVLMENLGEDCWDLLHELLQPDQFRRIRIGDAIIHHWIMRDKFLMKRLPQKRKDLQRKFHPEVIDYLACKLSTSRTRIETHLHVYQNDKIAAMYFMVLNVLVKEVLNPPEAFENSFLYRFECWRKNVSLQRPIHKYAYGDGHLDIKKKNENIKEEKMLISLKSISTNDKDYKIPSENSNEKFVDNPKLQRDSKLNNRDFPTKYSIMKISENSLENNNANENMHQQRMTLPRNPYKSYQKSRPQNTNFSKICHPENVKNNKCLEKIEETSPNNTLNQTKLNSLDNGEIVKNCQKSHQNRVNKESNIEKKVSTYLEYSPMQQIEKNKMKYAAYRKTKTSVAETTKDTRYFHPAKIQIKPSYFVNERTSTNTPNSSPKKIEILKRTQKNTNTREVLPKTAVENSTKLQNALQPTNNLKNIEEIPANTYAQTPSKIPVKIMKCDPPAPFSQTPARKAKKTSGSGSRAIKFCQGDIGEDVR